MARIKGCTLFSKNCIYLETGSTLISEAAMESGSNNDEVNGMRELSEQEQTKVTGGSLGFYLNSAIGPAVSLHSCE